MIYKTLHRKVKNESYSRNVPCALNLISTFLFLNRECFLSDFISLVFFSFFFFSYHLLLFVAGFGVVVVYCPRLPAMSSLPVLMMSSLPGLMKVNSPT